MANWLQKIMLPAASEKKSTALVKTKPGEVVVTESPVERLPNASIIYGIAASILIVVAIYFLFTGLWFTAFLVLLPAICFLGFALHFMTGK